MASTLCLHDVSHCRNRFSMYQRLEPGRKEIQTSSIERFAAVFGLTPIEFLRSRLPYTFLLRKRPPGAPHKLRQKKKREIVTPAQRNAQNRRVRPAKSGSFDRRFALFLRKSAAKRRLIDSPANSALRLRPYIGWNNAVEP